MKKILRIITFFLLLSASIVCLNFAVSSLWSESYLDLSSNKNYTLSTGSKEIINNLKAEQTIDLYISTEISKSYPQTAQYANYVKELLQRYTQQSAGKINLNIIEVTPFSEEEKTAISNGLKAFSDTNKKINLVFGAIIYNSEGQKRIIPNFVEYRQAYLEKDISENIYWLNKNQTPKTKIGLIAPDLNLQYTTNGLLNKHNNLNIFNKLSAEYDIQPISEYAVQIGVDINTLIVINPTHSFSNIGQYALDQFLLRGGNLIIFVDAVNEKAQSVNQSGGLDKLIKHWGINYTSEQTLGNIEYADELILNNKISKYLPWMSITETALNQNSDLTKGLKLIRVKSAAGLEISNTNKKAVQITPLISLKKHNELVDSQLVAKNYKMLVPQELKASPKEYSLGLMLEGKFSSMFTKNIMEGTKVSKQMLSFLPASMKDGRLIIISDTDILWDENYADKSFSAQNPVYGTVTWANNGDFIERLVNLSTNDSALLNLSAKQIHPQSELEDKFMKEAQKHYAPQQKELEKELVKYRKQQDTYTTLDTSLGDIKEQKQLSENLTRIEQQLQQINYQIDKLKEQKERNFIILNIVLISVLLAAMVIKFRISLKNRKYMSEGRN